MQEVIALNFGSITEAPGVNTSIAKRQISWKSLTSAKHLMAVETKNPIPLDSVSGPDRKSVV